MPFGGETDDVFGEMLDALRAGEVDGMVDDDVAFLALADDPDFEIAFTAPTRNEWGVAVSKTPPGHARRARRRARRGHARRSPRGMLGELVAGPRLPFRRSVT